MTETDITCTAPEVDRRRLLARIALVWVAVAVVLGATQVIAKFSELGPEPDAASLVSGWIQFDGHEYLNIARVGYSELNDQGRTRAVWFPAYPLLIHLGDVVVSPQVAAVAWSAMLGLLGALGAAVWMLDAGMTRRQVRLAVGVLLVYPYSWFLYGGAYPNSLLLALSVGAFLALERDRRYLAVLLCSVATMTHPLGLALLAGLVARQWERSGVLIDRVLPAVASLRSGGRRWTPPVTLSWRRIRLPDAVPLAGIAGLVGYSAYLWWQSGNPAEWLTGQSEYHGSTLRAIFKVDFFGRWVNWSDPKRAMTTHLQAAFVVVALVLLPRVRRRFGWGPAVFAAMTVVFPLLHTDDFNGSGRYLLQAFPIAAAAGTWLEERSLNTVRIWFAASAIALVALTFAFARSWYLT